MRLTCWKRCLPTLSKLIDERRTTIDAHRILTENGVFRQKRKETVDAVAAALILEIFLKRLAAEEHA